MNGPQILREIICKSILNKTGIPGYDYCLNPYGGCTHACVYCYASFMCRFSGHQEKWGEFLDVKVNAAEMLAKKLGSRNPPGGKLVIGTVTDAYQPAEASFKITRSCLELLAHYRRLEVHILTKSALVVRDLSVLQQLPLCHIGFTITTMDQEVARIMEPGASPPARRLEAALRLVDAGIPVWVFIAPLLPGLTDSREKLESLWRVLSDAGVAEIWVDCLNPYPAVLHRLRTKYREHFPWALPVLERYVSNPEEYKEMVQGIFRQLSNPLKCQMALVPSVRS
ncbi:MAG: radical SAM protein [Syntrophomonas sp.]|nr:radical SAM protein [Syntrophomonas sp.]